VVVEDVDVERFEAGVVIHPGTTIRGKKSAFGAGTELGKAGGGSFEDVVAGRRCQLYGGVFEDCALLDGVVVRGHAELRGGTLLEEGCEAAHHVGYKMTVMMPFTVAGSLVNFCDTLFAGGTGRADHGEIGSCLALYNYTPWGDKFASLFGNVPDGVFLRSKRIFVGGQTQIVSPVTVGFGSVVAAGSALRRNVGEGRIVGEPPTVIDEPFDAELLGVVWPKLLNTALFVGNLRALEAWYMHVRLPFASGDAHLAHVYQHALRQVQAGLAERTKRLRAFMTRVPASLARHAEAATLAVDEDERQRHLRRVDDHRRALAAWKVYESTLNIEAAPAASTALAEAVGTLRGSNFVAAIQELEEHRVTEASAVLAGIVRQHELS
jgi:UDP-N-acetylglucosamine/UDP-N-acetylgalactosamine diphosphorylase